METRSDGHACSSNYSPLPYELIQFTGAVCFVVVLLKGKGVVQGLLAAFVDYIKQRKTVALEELAAEFGLRVQVRLLSSGKQN